MSNFSWLPSPILEPLHSINMLTHSSCEARSICEWPRLSWHAQCSDDSFRLFFLLGLPPYSKRNNLDKTKIGNCKCIECLQHDKNGVCSIIFTCPQIYQRSLSLSPWNLLVWSSTLPCPTIRHGKWSSENELPWSDKCWLWLIKCLITLSHYQQWYSLTLYQFISFILCTYTLSMKSVYMIPVGLAPTIWEILSHWILTMESATIYLNRNLTSTPSSCRV